MYQVHGELQLWLMQQCCVYADLADALVQTNISSFIELIFY